MKSSLSAISKKATKDLQNWKLNPVWVLSEWSHKWSHFPDCIKEKNDGEFQVTNRSSQLVYEHHVKSILDSKARVDK